MRWTNALGLAAALLLSLPLRAHELKLGDGRVSTTPRVGYLMSCLQHWRGGPVHSGPWIHGDRWDPAEKPAVEGSVEWPSHRIAISIRDGERIISANNLPDHPTGIFPIQPSDPVYRYDSNPNAIRAQRILLRLPLNPTVAAAPSCVPMGMVGFTLDGVAIYNAVDNGGIDAVAHEVQDRCGGHPQHNGQYHYHGPSPCMPNEMSSGLVGYALDGFGIYGMKDPVTGRILHDRDLDACHGTTSPVMWNGRRVDIYHYVLTPEYPYTIGCFRGTPVKADFNAGQRRQIEGDLGGPGAQPGGRMQGRGAGPGMIGGGGQGPGMNGGGAQGRGPGMAGGGSQDRRGGPGMAGGEGPRGGRRERLLRAAKILGVSPETLREALGPPPPDLRTAAEKLGVSVQSLRSALGVHRRGGGGAQGWQ